MLSFVNELLQKFDGPHVIDWCTLTPAKTLYLCRNFGRELKWPIDIYEDPAQAECTLMNVTWKKIDRTNKDTISAKRCPKVIKKREFGKNFQIRKTVYEKKTLCLAGVGEENERRMHVFECEENSNDLTPVFLASDIGQGEINFLDDYRLFTRIGDPQKPPGLVWQVKYYQEEWEDDEYEELSSSQEVKIGG